MNRLPYFAALAFAIVAVISLFLDVAWAQVLTDRLPTTFAVIAVAVVGYYYWLGRIPAVFVAGIFVALAFADAAWAQDLAPVNEVADYLLNFMTGRLATTVAVIAVAVVGYLFWAGQLAMSAALGVVGGIALVFGSAQIVAILEGVAR